MFGYLSCALLALLAVLTPTGKDDANEVGSGSGIAVSVRIE